MRVLWLVRSNLEAHPGGDTTQILRTQAALADLGVSIVRRDRLPPPAELAACDLVHLFHLDRLWEHMAVCRALEAARRPIVLSPIYWPADELDRHARAGWQGALARTLGSDRYRAARLVQRFALHALGGRWSDFDRRLFSFRSAARRLLESCAVILPNSAAERDLIGREFGLERPSVVVPNAVDPEVFHLPPPGGKPRAGVLCVGRIEPRKNQLALLHALRDSTIPLTFIGRPGRFNQGYGRRCRRAAGPNVTFLEPLAPAALRPHYQAAAVHACVSWYETPGLASLEAAACGCRLVITPGGCTREYFGDEAEYAEPGDPATIRRAVERALARSTAAAAAQSTTAAEATRVPEATSAADDAVRLADRIRRELNWPAAAVATLRGYQMALASRPPHVP